MKITRRIVLTFSGLTLILLAGGLPLQGAEDHLAKLAIFRIDQKIDAPHFTLPDVTGQKISLSDFQGKFLMLNFWATW